MLILPSDQKVVGSSPTGCTILNFLILKHFQITQTWFIKEKILQKCQCVTVCVTGRDHFWFIRGVGVWSYGDCSEGK